MAVCQEGSILIKTIRRLTLDLRAIIRKGLWGFFGFLCIVVSLYPIKYFFGAKNVGLLATKSPELLLDGLWNTGFYGHIVFGGIALLLGWTQFSKRLRTKRVKLHKNVGKVYSVSAVISALCGMGIAFSATGGIAAQMGFISLGIIWFVSTFLAYRYIKKGAVIKHQVFMYYSYAACFAAVTLRVWLPILLVFMDDFIVAYRMVAWLCWVPNLLFAWYRTSLIAKNKQTQ
jgi:hypothetical protein